MDPALWARWGAALESNRWALVLQKTREGERILDFGCGQGAYVEALIRHRREALGVDIHCYEEWRERAAGLGRAEADLFSVTGTPLPFMDGYFSGVLAFEVLEHCADPLATLGELRRVSQRDLLLSVPDCETNDNLHQYSLARAHWTDLTHRNFFTRGSLDTTLRGSGWAPVWYGEAYRIDLNACFWEYVRLPRLLRRLARSMFRRSGLVRDPYSAILVHAEKVP